MIKLGDLAKDSISGFEGIVVADCLWLHGCRRLTIQPQKLHDGKPIDAQTFDELQLGLVKAKNHKPLSILTGGPRPEPVKR